MSGFHGPDRPSTLKVGRWDLAKSIALRALPTKVLLVEDNPIIAMNTEAMLEDLGVAQVLSASTVKQAIEHANSGGVDFAILDLRLADGEDSLPVAVHLTELGVPFVFATGFGEAIELGYDLGPTGVLAKPYRFEDLERVMLG